MVETEVVDVYVRLEPDSLVEVHRFPDAVCVQRFGTTVNYFPKFFPTKLPKSRRVVDWLVPIAFVFGVIFIAWRILVS